jgi:beta-N-acetylhexosaminidase
VHVCHATGVLAELALAAVFAGPADLPPRIVAGRSVEGRRIVAVREGDPLAPVRVLVTGSIHGEEPAGVRVIRQLRRMTPPPGVQLWTVRTLNPDGLAKDRRQNDHGVDLNRNFPTRWRGGGRPFDGYYPGPRPASEPETRAAMRLVRRIHPDLSIHFHQPLDVVYMTDSADPAILRAYARRSGLPARHMPRLNGTLTGWQNTTFSGTNAFVVEFAGGRPSDALIRRNARAVMAAGADQVTGASAAAAPKPRIVWSPIPFGADRIRQTRAYAVRHYGLHRARLIDPKVIVEHFTASTTYGSAFNTFAANQPDVELHELPGVCSHFIVDRDGTIHQLVRLKWMCRHTIGLNYTAIGIEHVGTSDADVMGRARELQASLRLTRWLMQRFGIRRRDVIGHAESLSSPYHRERVKALRNRTHGDFAAPAMRRYRRML